MSQNLQNFVKFQKFQLENLVDFEKCCKTHIFLQKSEPIQPKTSNILLVHRVADGPGVPRVQGGSRAVLSAVAEAPAPMSYPLGGGAAWPGLDRANLPRLVPGSIEAKFSKKICV